MRLNRLSFAVVLTAALVPLSCAVVNPPEKGERVSPAVPKPRTVLQRGDGIFGRWITDRYGLPAYEYTMDETADPRALWDPKLAPPSRLMWFPLGNRRVTAAAYNHGFVELFYYDSDPRWLNRYRPGRGDYAGGFGFYVEGDRLMTDFYPRRPEGSAFRRIYGAGYFEKRLVHRGLSFERIIYAPGGPFRDLPVLLSELRVRNAGGGVRKLSVFEYWDLNMESASALVRHPRLGIFLKGRDVFTPRFDPSRRLLVLEGKKIWGPRGGYPPRPRYYDPEPPSVFLASLDGVVSGFAFRNDSVFTGAGRWPEADVLKAIGDGPKDKYNGDGGGLCLVLRKEIDLPPGGEALLRFVFGYAKAVAAEDIIAALGDGRGCLKATVDSLKNEMASYSGPYGDVLNREARWDLCALTALSQWDGYFETPFIPQGGNYLYRWGVRGAVRDLAAYAQTLSYYDHEAARNQLRLILRSQGADGNFAYGMTGYGEPFRFYYRPSDLTLWTLQALDEYLFATRDFSFLDEELPWYPKEAGKSGTVYEHAMRALDFLRDGVGTGPRGLVRLKLSDWNDEMTFLAARDRPADIAMTFLCGESVMNTAMACAILPGFAEVARMKGDGARADGILRWREALAAALKEQWRGGWFSRAWSGLGRETGRDELFLEPQVWALLAGDIVTPDRARILVKNLRERLMEPSALGMMISTRRGGTGTTRPGEQEQGGIWFAMNGPAAVALARYDPAAGFRELVKNTLAWHADTCPSLWFGVWSGPDSFNSRWSSRPGESWYQETPLGGIGPQEYPVMNAHAHAQFLYALARLAGFHPGAGAYRIDPRIPGRRFAFSTPVVSVRREENRLEGTLVFRGDGVLSIDIVTPPEWGNTVPDARVDGMRVPCRREAGAVVMTVHYRKDRPFRWSLRRSAFP